jgi:hypothetical protein
MTGDVTVRTDDGVLLRVPLAQLKVDNKKASVSSDKRDSNKDNKTNSIPKNTKPNTPTVIK